MILGSHSSLMAKLCCNQNKQKEQSLESKTLPLEASTWKVKPEAPAFPNGST